jgi:hypothetical protein
MLTENTAAYLADFGEPATWYGAPWIVDRTGASLDSTKFGPNGLEQQTALVFFDKPQSDVLSNRVSTRNYKIRWPATQFVGIKHDDAIEIDGVKYSVMQPTSLFDGAWFETELQSV